MRGIVVWLLYRRRTLKRRISGEYLPLRNWYFGASLIALGLTLTAPITAPAAGVALTILTVGGILFLLSIVLIPLGLILL